MDRLKFYLKKAPIVSFPYRALRHSFLYSSYLKDFINFEIGRKNDRRFDNEWSDRYPCLHDKSSNFSFDRHYVFHTAWAARVLSESAPSEHVDISSYLYFSTIVSAFVPIRFYDIRTANLELSGFHFEYANILSLPFANESLASLSCMHVVEHVGLGRYGDEIDYDGDLKAIAELKRVVSCGGQLLFVVPIGKPAVKFNAHRIYSYRQIVDYFKDMDLFEFSLIADDGSQNCIVRHATEALANEQTYACGCFWFKKK